MLDTSKFFKKMMKYVFLSLFLSLFITGCNTESESVDLFQYKDSFIGDASAVSAIIRHLPNSESFKDMELKTKAEPYGMIVNYKSMMNHKKMQETIIHNATFLFALVKNADWIQFQFGDQTEEVSRKQLLDWYGQDVISFTNQEDLNEFIQNYVTDERLGEFFSEK
jgi:hypothetical protein